MQKVLEKGDGANTCHRRCQSQIPSYFRNTRKILSFSSVLFLQYAPGNGLGPSRWTPLYCKSFSPSFPFSPVHRVLHKVGFLVWKWLMLVTFLWMCLGGDIKKSCSFWSISGNIEECTHPLIHLYLRCLHCNAKAHSLCMKRFGLHSFPCTSVSQWIFTIYC